MNIYLEYEVDQDVKRFVNKIWVLDNSKNIDALRNNYLVPNGCFNIAIIRGEGVEIIEGDSSRLLRPGFYFCSLFTYQICFNILPNTKVFMIQLHNWTPSYMNLDLSETSNSVIRINLARFLKEGERAQDLYDDIEGLKAYVQSFFRRLERQNSVANLIEKACQLINEGTVNVSEICEQLGVSKRTLQIRFKSGTGLTLKQHIQTLQVRKTIDDLEAQRSKKIADVALDSGFFDESHFIKTFKKVVGKTPKKFDARKYFLSKKK